MLGLPVQGGGAPGGWTDQVEQEQQPRLQVEWEPEAQERAEERVGGGVSRHHHPVLHPPGLG